MKKNRWVLGLYGFLGFLGIPYLKDGDWRGYLWILWFIWFYYFIPEKKKE